jgi:hypothetical protein
VGWVFWDALELIQGPVGNNITKFHLGKSPATLIIINHVLKSTSEIPPIFCSSYGKRILSKLQWATPSLTLLQSTSYPSAPQKAQSKVSNTTRNLVDTQACPTLSHQQVLVPGNSPIRYPHLTLILSLMARHLTQRNSDQSMLRI